MITKIATDFMEKGASVGAIMGYMRAKDLTEKEKSSLAEEYGISENASFKLRNSIRGLGGDIYGGLNGAAVAGLASALGVLPKGNVGKTIAGGAILGSLVGGGLATNKYSKGKAQDFIARDAGLS